MKKYLQIPDEIGKRVQIRNIKDGFGHDLMGMYCDVYLDKKKIGYYNDDGWGGETEHAIDTGPYTELLTLLERHQWRHRMFTELGWNFYETADRIDDHAVVESLIEHLYDQKQKEKALKNIEKQSQKEILWGSWASYTRSSFKGNLTLEQMVRVYGLTKVQEYIDTNIKPKMKEGEEILNTNFEALGLRK